MKFYKKLIFIVLASIFSILGTAHAQNSKTSGTVARKILFIGDSMTGQLAQRLGAYGKENGFEVATVCWDGSTITKWGNSDKFSTYIKQEKPDAIFISLGINGLFDKNPAKRYGDAMKSIKSKAGNIPIIWIGPVSWPGRPGGEILNNWLAQELGAGHYYNSSGLSLPRQSSKNPHPTRAGMTTWIDNVVVWLKEKGAVKLPGYNKPKGEQMVKGKTYVYKKMKESL